MKQFITENWFKTFLILIIGFAFYWYELRPSQTRQRCYAEVALNPSLTYLMSVEPDVIKREELENKLINNRYANCLREKGLNN